MDPLERAIERLRSQKDRLLAERDEEVGKIKLAINPGGKRAIKRTREHYNNRVEAIDYVLNFLENFKEESCQD